MSRATIIKGAAELQGRQPLLPAAVSRIRRAGRGLLQDAGEIPPDAGGDKEEKAGQPTGEVGQQQLL